MNKNNKTKKGGSWNPFSNNETIDTCKAKCDKNFQVTPQSSTSSTPSTSNKGMFSWFPSFGKKEEAKQPLLTNQPPAQISGGKRRHKKPKKTRKNKSCKGTRKSSL